MATIVANKTVERRAFLISLGAHLLLFLLIFFLAQNTFTDTLVVRLVVESEIEPNRLIVPEEVAEPIEHENNRRKTQAQEAAKASQKSKTGAKQNQTANAKTLEDPWSQYDRRMRAQKSTNNDLRAQAQASRTQWGKEKLGKTGKQGHEETVEIPKGTSTANTRWKKGAARRLLSLPAIDYPESVRKKSGQGQVELRIEVNEHGRVEEIEIVRSSGHTRLDMNARNAYRNAVFSPSPSGESATGIVVVIFRMRDS